MHIFIYIIYILTKLVFESQAFSSSELHDIEGATEVTQPRW